MNTNKEIKKIVPKKIASSTNYYFCILFCVTALLALSVFWVWMFVQLVYGFYVGFALKNILFVVFVFLMLLMAFGYCFLLSLSLFRCWKFGYLDWGAIRLFKSPSKSTKASSTKSPTKEV